MTRPDLNAMAESVDVKQTADEFVGWPELVDAARRAESVEVRAPDDEAPAVSPEGGASEALARVSALADKWASYAKATAPEYQPLMLWSAAAEHLRYALGQTTDSDPVANEGGA